MTVIPFNDSAGTWVRLMRGDATVDLARWPGPHRPGEVIHTTDGGRFVFEQLDPDAHGGPEAIYRWTPNP